MMKLIIKTKDTKLFLWIPYFLVTKKMALRALEKGNLEINEQALENIPMLLKELKIFAKKNRRFTILDIKSKDGEIVKIVL